MQTLLIQSAVSPVIIGKSKGIHTAMEACRKASKEKGPVLFQGETGTGKLLLATYLHLLSEQKDQPFTVFDCSVPQQGVEDLLADLLVAERRLKSLHGGTLYFREVTSLGLQQQAKLYEICQMAESMGYRVLFGSSQNVHLLIYEKALDSNLYQYIIQQEISIPALRQRKEDIPDLMAHFIKVFNQGLRKSIQGLTPQAEETLLNYRWPGNVEEVKYVLKRAMILSTEPFIGQRHLTEYLGEMGENVFHTQDVMPLERMEEILLRSALNRYGYTLEGKKRAARALNISLATLYNKVKRFNLNG